MHHCESCGLELPDQTDFCGSCGHPLNTATARALTDISAGSLPATGEVVTDISTGLLPTSSPQDTSTEQIWADKTRIQETPNLPMSEDNEQEEEYSDALVDVAIPLMPANDVPMVQGTPSTGGVSMAQGTPSTGNVPMVQGTPSTGNPSTATQLHSAASPHTQPSHTTPLHTAAPPHAQPSHTAPPHTAAPPHTQNLPPSSSSHLPAQHARTSSSHLHHSPTEADAHEESSSKKKKHHRPQEKPPARPVQRRLSRKRAIVLILLLLIAIIIFAVLGGPLALASIFFGGPASSATVTIIPASSDLQNTYTISVVTGTPDASMNQVEGARLLSTTTSANTQTVKATGQGTIPGTQASGTLQVENHDPSNSLTLNAGTVFANQLSPPNIHMQLDQAVDLPPGGFTDVAAAHVVEVGTIGNLPGPCCGPGPNFQNQCDGISNCGPAHDIFNSAAFTGGTDPQTYSVVQQSDIDGAANALEQANAPDAQQVLQGQVQAHEQFIGTPQCKPNVTSDRPAGDKAASVTVTLTFTCTGEVYSQDAALSMAVQLLTNQSAADPGPQYVLAGNIATTVTNAALADAGQGTVALTINAEGVWVYQFGTAQKQALAKLMANKKKQDVQALLLQQQGVVRVAIHLVGGDGSLFPTDPHQIRIVVQNVPGVQAITASTT
jgi:hypothetical protein